MNYIFGVSSLLIIKSVLRNVLFYKLDKHKNKS